MIGMSSNKQFLFYIEAVRKLGPRLIPNPFDITKTQNGLGVLFSPKPFCQLKNKNQEVQT